MSGDVHVRFCERLEGRFLRATRLVCAFELETDAERFYSVLGNRLGKFGLEVAAEKTNLLRFSPINWKASGTYSRSIQDTLHRGKYYVFVVSWN